MKLAICFGGSQDMYFKHANILNFLAKKFNRKSKFVFKQDNNEIKVFFAMGPRKDKLRERLEEDVLKNKEKASQPASEIVKEIKKYNPNYVLFFGIAGGINKLNLNDIVYPINFREISAKSKWMIHKQNISSKNIKVINNILGSDKLTTITTNLFFSKDRTGPSKYKHHPEKWDKLWPTILSELKRRKIHVQGEDAGKLWCMLKFHEEFLPWLRKQGDLIEMESAVFAQTFKNNIGIMLQISDIVGHINLNTKRKHVDWNKFNKNVARNILKVLNI
jgi:hypothetical protein